MRSFTIGIITGGIVALAGILSAQATAPERGPVCHSVTEDSIITDCDYRDGAWYQKGDR